MKKFVVLSAALVALSSGMFADTLFSGNVGSFTVITGNPLSTYTNSQIPYSGSPVNVTNSQVPFWNNPSQDNTGLADSACTFTGCASGGGHVANIGDLLGGVVTGTDLIGTNLTGTPSATNTSTTISGAYFAGTTGNGDSVSAATPTNVAGLGTSTVVPNQEFSFVSQATALQVSVLFAYSGLDCPVGTSNCGTGQWTSFGTYILANGSCGSNCLFTPTAISNGVSMNLGTPTTAVTDPNDNATTAYGYYATVCYAFSGGVCTNSVTYTTGAGNFTNSSLPSLQSALAWNHFAFFDLASGQMVIGFEDGLAVGPEGIGDFNDLVFSVSGNQVLFSGTSTPEPGTIAIMGLGLAGLGLIGRRRFAKK